MDKVLGFFYEVVKIVSKVFEIWNNFGADFDYDYETDFNGEGGLRENFEKIINVFKG